MSNIKTVKKSNWKNYLIKASQFFETARMAYLNENWNAVGLNAVHAVIASNDALTVYYKTVRSVSEKHSDAVNLLLEVFKNDEASRSFSKHLLWLVNRKNLVEYESRLFYQKEADEALKHAERFFNWAKSKLPK